MDGATTLKLGLWLAEKQHQPWVRGINDCCTLFMEWHDHRFGTDTLSEIKGRYTDLKSAIRFATKFGDLSNWFHKNGYIQVDTPETGDIVMVQHARWFSSAYFICMNIAWGIQDDGTGLSKHPVETMQEHKIWRHKWDLTQ